jgi:CRISPR-associated endonuclease/helicase Cas3
MSVALTDSPLDAYKALTGFGKPNPMQVAVWNLFAAENAADIGVLLHAPTGSGKTEAVGVPALAYGKRLILVYPTRSLVDDQIGRFSDMLKRLSTLRAGKPVALAIDTGAVSKRYVWVDGQEQPSDANPRRHLYHGDVIITTLDKFLYRFFGFGEQKKSYIFPLRINYGLKDALICFDEAHSYDDVAFTNFARLIQTLYRRGRNLMLMTATMPEAKRKGHLDFLESVDFVDNVSNRAAFQEFTQTHFQDRQYPQRTLRLVSASLDDPEEADNEFLAETVSELVEVLAHEAVTRSSAERRIIVIAEKVRDAVAVYRILKEQVQGSNPVWLYHGRLTDKRRKYVYEQIKKADDVKGSSYLLVTTSAIEVGCDLDAHLLITQRCDPDRLIQRAGRCNRRQQMPDAEVVVVGDTIPGWLTTLSEADLAVYDQALQAQADQPLDSIPLLACLKKVPAIDFRVEMMFDMLYEYVYEAKLENKPLHDKGLIVTRSWEPSLTLYTSLDKQDRPVDPVSVPMRSCRTQPEESLNADWMVTKLGYDASEGHFVHTNLGGWECAYSIDVLACPNPTLYDLNEEEGWVVLPKLFNGGFSSGYRRVLSREENGQKSLLWYIAALKEAEPASSTTTVDGDSEAENSSEETTDE